MLPYIIYLKTKNVVPETPVLISTCACKEEKNPHLINRIIHLMHELFRLSALTASCSFPSHQFPIPIGIRYIEMEGNPIPVHMSVSMDPWFFGQY